MNDTIRRYPPIVGKLSIEIQENRKTGGIAFAASYGGIWGAIFTGPMDSLDEALIAISHEFNGLFYSRALDGEMAPLLDSHAHDLVSSQ